MSHQHSFQAKNVYDIYFTVECSCGHAVKRLLPPCQHGGHSNQMMAWFCAARRVFYGESRAPRRTSEEVALERRHRGEAIARRREFNKRKRAERDARRAERLAKEQAAGAAA